MIVQATASGSAPIKVAIDRAPNSCPVCKRGIEALFRMAHWTGKTEALLGVFDK